MKYHPVLSTVVGILAVLATAAAAVLVVLSKYIVDATAVVLDLVSRSL